MLPIVHGSGDMAQEVRETLIAAPYDCLAVPLPPSVESPLEQAIGRLPRISLVTLPEPDHDRGPTVSYVPVDPCQPVIMSIRVAMGEQIARAYLDRDVQVFEPDPFPAPDPFALKQLSLEAFACALLPSLPPPIEGSQRRARINWMAFRLHELELDYEAILCVCPVADWPWLRDAYQERRNYERPELPAGRPQAHEVAPKSLYFILGELPFLTELSERRREEVRSDRLLSIDGIKELLIESRGHYDAQQRSRHTKITPYLLQQYLQYVRNLALLDRRLTPDLYSLVTAAKQLAGDDFAVALLETAKRYRYQPDDDESNDDRLLAGIGRLEFPDGTVAQAKNRLPGPPLAWRTLTLKPNPTPRTSRQWGLRWNPYRQCSWPPEDTRIESFTSHVREQATAILGADLARVEKFTTSVKDGIDLRETMRRWPESLRRRSAVGPKRMELYVKELPPARGRVEVVVFVFESPVEPDRFSWQATWYAEHAQESTLCFYATPFHNSMVGPGVGQSEYGGALFLFPPRAIPDIWTDPRLSFTRTLEERLVAAAVLHSQERHVALVAPTPPRARWRHMARRFGKRLVYIPLHRFSGRTIDRLRRFHVLNGHDIRSYAAKFIQE
jgi:hypothetical protein